MWGGAGSASVRRDGREIDAWGHVVHSSLSYRMKSGNIKQIMFLITPRTARVKIGSAGQGVKASELNRLRRAGRAENQSKVQNL